MQQYARLLQGFRMLSWLGRRSVRVKRIWNQITLATAPKAHKSLDLDAGTRKAMDADFGLWPMTIEAPRFFDSRSQLEEVERILREL
jgi:hypothetical protein